MVYPVTVETLGSQTVHRNFNICRLLEKTKFMEKAGIGINKMKKDMENYGLSQPQFIEEDFFFKVIFNGPYDLINSDNSINLINSVNSINLIDEYELNERQIKILNRMQDENLLVSVSSYGNHFNVSDATARRDLNKLFNLGFVTKFKHKCNRIFYKLKA